jgi:hypothetical protein
LQQNTISVLIYLHYGKIRGLGCGVKEGVELRGVTEPDSCSSSELKRLAEQSIITDLRSASALSHLDILAYTLDNPFIENNSSGELPSEDTLAEKEEDRIALLGSSKPKYNQFCILIQFLL